MGIYVHISLRTSIRHRATTRLRPRTEQAVVLRADKDGTFRTMDNAVLGKFGAKFAQEVCMCACVCVMGSDINM